MAYDLSRMNSQSFQHLLESLALESISKQGTVFPSGADGGRDFTYEGKIPGYEAARWEGYLVLQVKYREFSGQRDDAEWLVQQLAKERTRFENDEFGRRKPDYYIICSNVRLSGADGKRAGRSTKGGNTKVREYLDTWIKDLPLRDFDIWSATKIERLLDRHEHVRRAYQHFVTPADVLSALLEEHRKPDFKITIKRAMKKALARDQHVQLKDAGDARDSGLRSSQVFTDLPFDSPQ